MGLSIPKIPSDAVDREHPRHLEAGDYEVLIAEKIALLIADDRAQNSNLEETGHSSPTGDILISRRERKKHVAPVLVDSGHAQREVPPREPLDEIVREVQL
jgi:hypothetical protein